MRTNRSTTRRDIAAQILPALRGTVSSNRRVIAHFTDTDEALTFAGSRWASALSRLGTSCPDHFLRTRICPFFVDWDPAAGTVDTLKAAIRMQVGDYRSEYQRYYDSFATPDSPKLRDSNPSVVIIPGVGLFGFGRNKKEARIATEFFLNAINVMAGATALETPDRHDGSRCPRLAERSRPLSSNSSTTTSRCRARKRSASSTGRSKKRSCSGCPPRRNSAARL